MRWKKERKRNIFVFFLEIHSHKKQPEYLHNMHSISANKTTTMSEKEERKNTLKRECSWTCSHSKPSSWCFIATLRISFHYKSNALLLNTHTSKVYAEALSNASTQRLMLLCCVSLRSIFVIQHQWEAPPFLCFFFPRCTMLAALSIGWLENIFFCCCLRLLHKCNKRSRRKNPNGFLCCLKYDSSVYLTAFCVSVRSEYSARSAAVRAFVP